MALRRRFLLWAYGTNGTAACSDQDPMCRHPPPPPSLIDANGTTFFPIDGDVTLPVDLHPKSRLLPNLLFAAAALLAASFFLLLATYAVHRLRRRRRLLSAASASIAPSSDDGGGDFDLFQDGEADHHVWHIRTVGLDDATIQSIGSRVYNPKDGLLADCAVCLAELRDGEVLRLLPKCAHAFHLSCVDTWLRSHVNCPLCRAPVLSPEDADNPIESEPIPIPIAPTESESNHAPPPELEIAIDINTIGSSSTNSSSPLPIDLGDDDGLQPIRRSVSLDSSAMAALLRRVNSEMKLSRERKEDQSAKNRGKKGAAALQKGPLQMKRSMSSRSGRFFLSRYARPRSSVLPL